MSKTLEFSNISSPSLTASSDISSINLYGFTSASSLVSKASVPFIP